ncbi:MAG: hypothetical protein K0S34_103 [Bacillales bacterium]|jgi:hypothetical protein|nr:hypothetical protein [Bacillales bacterium]
MISSIFIILPITFNSFVEFLKDVGVIKDTNTWIGFYSNVVSSSIGVVGTIMVLIYQFDKKSIEDRKNFIKITKNLLNQELLGNYETLKKHSVLKILNLKIKNGSTSSSFNVDGLFEYDIYNEFKFDLVKSGESTVGNYINFYLALKKLEKTKSLNDLNVEEVRKICTDLNIEFIPRDK